MWQLWTNVAFAVHHRSPTISRPAMFLTFQKSAASSSTTSTNMSTNLSVNSRPNMYVKRAPNRKARKKTRATGCDDSESRCHNVIPAPAAGAVFRSRSGCVEDGVLRVFWVVLPLVGACTSGSIVSDIVMCVWCAVRTYYVYACSWGILGGLGQYEEWQILRRWVDSKCDVGSELSHKLITS